MRAIIVGCGSIGARRARILKALGVDVVVYDKVYGRSEKLADELSIYALMRTGNIVPQYKDYDVVLICTPPSSHIELATAFAEIGINLFIEKPLAPCLDIEAITRLLRTMQEKGVWGLMGMSYRQLPSLREFANKLCDKPILSAEMYAGQYLEDWCPNVNIRETYHVKQGEGGIVLDSLSHELDICNWLFGEIDAITGLVGNTGEWAIDDTVTCLVKMQSGAAVSIHLDYWARPREHYINVVWADSGDQNTARWVFEPSEADAMYEGEMRHLVRCVERDIQGQPDIFQGVKTLEWLDAVRRSKGTWERIDNVWAATRTTSN